MKQIGTFRLKVMSTTVPKRLSGGILKKYKYGSIAVHSPKLAGFIGKKVMIRIFEE